MALLKTIGGEQGYFKGGFLGFQGSGKTYTMTLLAIGLRNHFKLSGPIAFFDTEGGSENVASLIKRSTGLDPVGVKSRALDDLVTFVGECVEAKVSVAIVESMTHVWRELMDSFLSQVNEKRRTKRMPPRKNLTMADWAPLKAIWNSRWSDLYLNAPLHLIIAGRAGFEYEEGRDEETGDKTLTKTGIKMRVEAEFAYEPSLLVEMERDQVPNGHGGFTLIRRAVVVKDRFAAIDGQTVEFSGKTSEEALRQTFEFFRPHIECLTPGAYNPVDTRAKTDTGADEDGDSEWARERKTRVILCEEIQGELVAHGLAGQSAADKEKRLGLLFDLFATRSWTAVESMESAKLRAGLAALRARLAPPPTEQATIPDTEAPAATGGISEAEAERRKVLAKVQGLEARLALAGPDLGAARLQHCGAAEIDGASLDALVAYRDALEAQLAAKGNSKTNGRKKAAPAEVAS